MLSVPRKSAISQKQLFLVKPTSTVVSFSNPSSISISRTNQRTTHFTETPPAKPSFCNQNPFYGYLFSHLKSPPDVLEARRLHALLVVSGFFHPNNSDGVLGSQLVNVYAGFGCFNAALLVFYELPRKGNISWNAVIRGFVDTGQFPKAIEFYNLMLNHGVVPDSFTYPFVLKACCGLNDLEQGRKVRDLIVCNQAGYNMKNNVYVCCALIDMFAKCGSLYEARQVFDEMPERDLATWSVIICGASLNGELLEALCLFKSMRMDGTRPDSAIVAALVPVCGRLEDRHIGRALHGSAIMFGCDCDLFVSNALIDMYCKLGDTNSAHILFCSMVHKDVVTWSSLIAGYSQNCLYRESFEHFLQMKRSGIRTNAITAASVLPGLGKLQLLRLGKEMHGYVLKHGFESDVVLSSALIDMYSNCGSLREAGGIFKIMSNRDITLWNSMIAGYTLSGEIDLAFGIFRRIWNCHIRPTAITLLSILPICTRMGTLRQGKEIHCYAIRSGLGKFVSIGNSLLDMYCKCGYLQLGVNVFDQMTEKNVVTYNTVISAHGVYGLGERALLFSEQMKESGIRPNKITFIALLSACSHSGLLERGWVIFNCMVSDYNLLPDMEHYACVVDLLGRAGKLDKAYEFVLKMPVEPNTDVLGSLLGACRVHKNVELAQRLGKHILQKNMNDSSYHILLSNIYASAGRWNDAMKLRTMIKEKGLVKEPGCSWIVLSSNIHKFHSRDNMHPNFSKIQEIAETLLLEMKDIHRI